MDTSNSNVTDPGMVSEDSYMKQHLFGTSLWVLGGIGLVIWATKKGRKGRFWWFLLGSTGGSAVGYIIDGLKNK